MEISREEKLLKVAYEEFLHHGYGRVRMGDIAKKASISRAVLYQIFSTKEELFNRLFSDQLDKIIEDIRVDLSSLSSSGDKLRCAIDHWAVKNFDLIKSSPEASELLDVGLEFSRDIFEEAFQEFEKIIESLLPDDIELKAVLLAHILSSSLRGLKRTARDSHELQQMIDGLLLQCRL